MKKHAYCLSQRKWGNSLFECKSQFRLNDFWMQIKSFFSISVGVSGLYGVWMKRLQFVGSTCQGDSNICNLAEHERLLNAKTFCAYVAYTNCISRERGKEESHISLYMRYNWDDTIYQYQRIQFSHIKNLWTPQTTKKNMESNSSVCPRVCISLMISM